MLWAPRCAADNIRKGARSDGSPLAEACDGGHSPLVQWLVSTFSIPVDDVRGSVLRGLCAGRSLDILRFMTDRFDLTAQDIREHDALRSVEDWVKERFGA